MMFSRLDAALFFSCNRVTKVSHGVFFEHITRNVLYIFFSRFIMLLIRFFLFIFGNCILFSGFYRMDVMNVRIGQQFWIADNGTFCNEYFSFFGNFICNNGCPLSNGKLCRIFYKNLRRNMERKKAEQI